MPNARPSSVTYAALPVLSLGRDTAEALLVWQDRAPGRIFKRTLDLVLAAALLLALSPLLAVLALLISRDGGAPVFRHRRVGRNGQFFSCLKFRTMAPDADALLQSYLAGDAEALAEWEQDRKLRYDPRVTRLGRFLRHTSLDELPQLWNVLRGDMSLVGPRPVVQEELVKYGDKLGYYLALRPGLTGFWQVNGRNDVTYHERVEMDAWYVQNRSFWLDCRILLKTAAVVIRRDGAY